MSTGQAITIGPLSETLESSSLDFHPDGTLYGIVGISGSDFIVTINTNTGATTIVAMLTSELAGRDVAFSSGCRTLLATSSDNVDPMNPTTLVAIDLLGNVQIIGSLPITASSLERSPIGFFAFNRSSGHLSRISVISGQAADLFDLSSVLGPDKYLAALAYSRMTGLLYSVDSETSNLVEIDLNFNEARVVGHLGSTRIIGGLAFEPF